MEWRLNKRVDSDLISLNLKPWVDIFWVSWSYWWLDADKILCAIVHAHNDSDTADNFSSSISWTFYNLSDWWTILATWTVTAQAEWWAARTENFYITIDKDSLLITRHSSYTPTWTNVWSLIELYTWYAIEQTLYANLFTEYDNPWQTFTTIWWWDINMARVWMAHSWWPYTDNITISVYDSTYSTLLWTSDNELDLNTVSSWATFRPYDFYFTWITLDPATQYAIRINTWGTTLEWAVRTARNTWVYSWGSFSANSSLDMAFQIFIWWYTCKLTYWVDEFSYESAYNRYWASMWYINITKP